MDPHNPQNWNLPNDLVAFNGQSTPGLYRSLYRYVGRCSHIGCSLPHRAGNGYCCGDHQELARLNADAAASFHYIGGFRSQEEKEIICCISLLNRWRGFQVGIPNLDHQDVFGHFPWELPEIFRTDLGKCNWIFFKTPPSTYNQIRSTRVKWKLNRRVELQLLGEHHEPVFMTAMSLTYQTGTGNLNAEEVIEDELLREWSMHLFQSMGFALYCLSSTIGQTKGDPKVKKEDKAKGTPKPRAPSNKKLCLKSKLVSGGSKTDSGLSRDMVLSQPSIQHHYDYEYSSFYPIAYDIAKHFCELAAYYHSDTSHSLDYSLYPGLYQ